MTGHETLSLYEAVGKGALRVASVPDIKLLENLGFRVGTRIAVQTRYRLGGPVLLRVEDSYTVAVGKDVARQIGVTEETVAGEPALREAFA
ncbi:MAG: ferrous iron transport protein A [Oscillospiraceae bacterium]|nr:ferrous iron transport protein A [Oscillospiraceae bacterium]